MNYAAQPADAPTRPASEMWESSYEANTMPIEPTGTCFFCWAGDRDRAIREIRATEQEVGT